MFIISGCTGFSRDRAASTVDTEFHKGTQGLDMRFVKNNPPSLVYDYEGTTNQQEVTVMVELRNKGAFDISSGKLYLSGFDRSIIKDISESAIDFNIEGKSRFNSEGGFDVITLTSDKAGTVDLTDFLGVDSIQQKMIVHACYNYETTAAPVVCIDPDPYREVGEKACKSNDLITGVSGGQGAPLIITKVEEEMAPGKVFFKIHVSKSGPGTVVGIFNDCPFDVKYKDIGDILSYTITANTLGATSTNSGDCEPSKLKLIDGKGVIYCNFDATTDGSAYKTPLNIKLEYGYMDSVSKQIEIRSTASPN